MGCAEMSLLKFSVEREGPKARQQQQEDTYLWRNQEVYKADEDLLKCQ